jgi:hypothetical protein
MAGTEVESNDGAAYELLMGQWSRGAGFVFLDGLQPAAGMAWLDVGCGSGAFSSAAPPARCWASTPRRRSWIPLEVAALGGRPRSGVATRCCSRSSTCHRVSTSSSTPEPILRSQSPGCGHGVNCEIRSAKLCFTADETAVDLNETAGLMRPTARKRVDQR